MKKIELSRRKFLKGTGALIVSFNLFPPASLVCGQARAATEGEPDPTQLDSWIAIGADGSITVFTSKVELGTGIETALAQVAAEELDVPWQRIKVDMGDTTKTIDQATTSGSRTIERAGPQIRQAAAAARTSFDPSFLSRSTNAETARSSPMRPSVIAPSRRLLS